MKNLLFPIAFAALFLFQGCNSNSRQAHKPQREPVAFPQVQLPSYINDNRQAVSYMARHYWDKFFALGQAGATAEGSVQKDGMKGKGRIYGVDSLSFEEAFGMYAQLLSMAQPKDMGISVKGLMSKLDSLALGGDRKPLLTVMSRLEHYFYDPNSPVLDEEIYLCALNGILAAKSLSELDKMQYEYQHKICSLNRVGTPAADFAFRELNGRRYAAEDGNELPQQDMTPIAFGRYVEKSLYDIKGEYTLIFFNNPDCNACAGILQAIKESPLTELVKQGKLKVLAMYIDEDLTAWRENSGKYPMEWIYAYDHKLVLRDNNIYGLRAIPSLYLLDKEKRVLLKDAPVEDIINYLCK